MGIPLPMADDDEPDDTPLYEYVAQMQADIAAVIAASNAAEDAVAAATTVAQVEAVTATWPVI